MILLPTIHELAFATRATFEEWELTHNGEQIPESLHRPKVCLKASYERSLRIAGLLPHLPHSSKMCDLSRNDAGCIDPGELYEEIVETESKDIGVFREDSLQRMGSKNPRLFPS